MDNVQKEDAFFSDVFPKSVSYPFPPTALQRCHTQTIRDSSSSTKKDFAKVTKTFLNPEEHQNRFIGSKVTVISLKGFDFAYG